MGFFDKVLSVLGFEDENEVVSSKNRKKKEEKIDKIKINSKFDLGEVIIEEKDKIYKPQTQNEIEDIVQLLMKGFDINIDFSEFVEIDKIRALDFLSGVVYVLNANIERQQDFIYSIKFDKNNKN